MVEFFLLPDSFIILAFRTTRLIAVTKLEWMIDVCPIPSTDYDCGCSSACVAYKNGQFVQTPINTTQ